MSPSMWTLGESVNFLSCRIADLVCWQKKHHEKWLIEDCPFLLFFLSFSPSYFGPVYIYSVSGWHSYSLLLDLHKCLKAQCKLLSWELLNMLNISPTPTFNFGWHQWAAVRERACLIWLGTFLHPLTNQWRLFNGSPHYSSILKSIKSPPRSAVTVSAGQKWMELPRHLPINLLDVFCVGGKFLDFFHGYFILNAG